MKRTILLLTTLLIALNAQAQLTDQDVRNAYYSSYRYEKSQNYADAIKALTPVVEAYPDGYTANLRMGWLHYLQGGFATARRHYEKAIKVAPYSIEAKLGVTLPLLAQEKYEEVETYCKMVIRMDANNYIANLRLTASLRLQKKYDAAEVVATRLLAYFPTDVAFLNEFGLLKVAKGDKARAVRVFNDVVILDPENIIAKAQLAQLVPADR